MGFRYSLGWRYLEISRDIQGWDNNGEDVGKKRRKCNGTGMIQCALVCLLKLEA